MRLSRTRHRRRELHRRLQTRPRILAEYIRYGSDGSTLAFLPTTARTTDLWLPDASGVYQQYGNGEVGIIVGNAVWCQPSVTNKCTTYSEPQSLVTPTTAAGFNAGTTNLSAFDTGSGCLFGVVDDETEIDSAGLGNLNTSGRVYKIDNSGGSGSGLVTVSGSVGNTNTHAMSIFGRVESGLEGRLAFNGAASGPEFTFFSNTSYQRIENVQVPSVDTRSLQVLATSGNIVYFFIPQLEERGFVTPPVVTAGSAVAINATEPKFTTVNPTTNFSGSFIWKPAAASQGTIWLLGNYTDANNAWGVLHDGTNVIFRNRVSGSNNDAVKALSYAADTEYLIHFKHDTELGLDVAVDRVAGTNDSTTTAVTNAANTFIQQDGNGAAHATGSMRQINIQKHVIGWSNAEWLAS